MQHRLMTSQATFGASKAELEAARAELNAQKARKVLTLSAFGVFVVTFVSALIIIL